jgi:hypothetical protein
MYREERNRTNEVVDHRIIYLGEGSAERLHNSLSSLLLRHYRVIIISKKIDFGLFLLMEGRMLAGKLRTIRPTLMILQGRAQSSSISSRGASQKKIKVAIQVFLWQLFKFLK